MSNFAHLHLHSQFSLLDGANRLEDVVARAAALEMPAIALTDHGNMFGAMDFYTTARRHNIKPILGIEAYVAQGDHRDRDPRRGRSNHLVLLARNETGFRNLIKLTSRSYLEGFYYKPRIDTALLKEFSEGLIGLSACIKGEINEHILNRREAAAEARARELRDILGDGNFYLELQDHGIEAQSQANEVLRAMSKRTGIPLVATNDCHYLRREDAEAHDVLLCIGTQKNIADTDRIRYASDEFYLKNAQEMLKVFPDDVTAIENTVAIAERCNLELPEGKFYLPDFPVPAGHSLDSYLTEVTNGGLEERLEQLRRRNAEVLRKFSADMYHDRLRTELEIITKMGFAGYFLIVWDFMRHARREGIPIGPGRGSAAGSLVAYCLRITDIDPLQYGLLFERFLNPERVSLPDIDIDFCMRRRGEVIQYVNEKYGRDRVAQIITFGTLAAKAVVRDVGRVMGIPYAKVDRVAKMIPDMTRSLREAALEVPDLAEAVSTDAEVRKIVEIGSRLEGLTRHASLHAAGVVIAPCPIDELVPLYKTSKDEVVTQWDKDVIEDLGLLKMDFLGLRTLTVIDDCLRDLRHQGTELDLDAVALDDPKTFELFREGKTNGIFQFESSGMKDLLRRARTSKFEDLAAFNALYRPGALSVGMVEEYIQRKQGKKRIRYILPETKPILEETYGVIAYQEQVMQIAVEIGGFSMGEADILRKAMGKKRPEVMAEQKEKFLAGAEGRGFKRQKAQELWDHIEPFAGYGFNKSHSVAYAMLAYKTAYLKAHYPVAFMAAMLTSEMSTKDNVAKYVQECRDMGIEVLPPDVNESAWPFASVGDSIRFGLGAVKGIGESAVESILEARNQTGRFRSFCHFATALDSRAVNHKVFECLIKSGSFDGFGAARSALAECLDRILDYASRRRKEIEEGQATLFSSESLPEPKPDESLVEWAEEDRLRYERETLGLYLTGHPLRQFENELEDRATHTTANLHASLNGKATVLGLISRLRKIKIKTGKNAGRFMAKLVLEDLVSTVSVTVFADRLEEFERELVEDNIVLLTGSVRGEGADVEMTVDTIETLDLPSKSSVAAQSIEIRIRAGVSTSDLLQLRDLLIEHQGKDEVRLRVELQNSSIEVAPESRFQVRFDEDLHSKIDALLGDGSIRRLEPSVAA